MKFAGIAASLLFTALSASAQIVTDPEAAFHTSGEMGKTVLLVFSGSDWCVPCIKFERNVLSDSTFLHYAAQNLVVLKADFPQTKPVAPGLKAQYEALAELFNSEGAFPKIVLLNANKELLATLPVSYEPDEFIRQIVKDAPHKQN
jgi:thioredoxin-related protein